MNVTQCSKQTICIITIHIFWGQEKLFRITLSPHKWSDFNTFLYQIPPYSPEASNCDCVCERFKSLTELLSSCCVMRWGDVDVSGYKSGSWHVVLVVAPFPLSEKLFSTSSSVVQSPGGFGMGKPSWWTGLIAEGKFGN